MRLMPSDLLIATKSAWEQRFRAYALFVAGLIATWAALFCVSAFHAQDVERGRLEDRTGHLSETDSSRDLLALTATDRWADQTITVVAVEPVGDQPLSPPGVSELPDVGRVAVSPALAGAIADDPDLAERYDVQMQIAPAGVVNGGELLAYRRVPDGTLSADGDRILRSEQGEYVGEGPVLRLGAFGPPGSAAPDALPITVGFSDGAIEATELATYTAMIAAPALVLLAVTLAVSSAARDRRMSLLHFLGVGPRRRFALVLLESLVPTVPGVVAACLSWNIIGRQEWLLIGSGHRLLTGDGTLPATQLIATGAAALAATVVVAAAIALAFTTPAGGRPQAGRRKLSRLAPVPAAAAAGLLFAALVSSGPARTDLAFAGSVLAVIAAPLLIPTVLRVAGSALTQQGRPNVWLSGHVMAHDPARSGRPFAGLAALTLIVGASTGYLAVAQYTEEPAGLASGNQVVGVEWRGSVSDPLGQLQGHLPDTLVARYATGQDTDHHATGGDTDHDHDAATSQGAEPSSSDATGSGGAVPLEPSDLPDGETSLTIAATCAQLLEVTTGLSCAPTGEVTGTGLPDLAHKLSALTHGELITTVRIGDIPPDGHPAAHDDGHTHESVLVIGTGAAAGLDQRVRTAAAHVLPLTNITGLALSGEVPSPLVRWIHSGLVAAALLLGFACLITLRDRFSGIIGQHRALSLIGLGQANFRRLALSLFVVPYAVAVACGLVLGAFSALVFSAKVGTPWGDLAAVAIILILGGVLTAALLPRSVVPAGPSASISASVVRSTIANTAAKPASPP